jgi:hypothetical protein
MQLDSLDSQFETPNFIAHRKASDPKPQSTPALFPQHIHTRASLNLLEFPTVFYFCCLLFYLESQEGIW